MEAIQYMTLGISWPAVAGQGLLSGMLILKRLSRIRPNLQVIRVRFMNILGSRAVTAAGPWALFKYATNSILFVLLLQFTVEVAPWIEFQANGSLVFILQTILPMPLALGWINRLELAVFIVGFLMIPPVEAAMASLINWTINLAQPGSYGGYDLLNQHLYKHLDHVHTAFTPG